jgi:hypothetical protein
MGISMGGLVARYALRQLEIQGYDHQTKIFFSMDSPHNGANVPVGVQAALYHIKNYGISFCFPFCASPYNVNVTINPANYVDEIGQFFTLLNTMAAKQMLIYKVSASSSGLYYDNSVHQAFMSEIQSMGFPEKCYNVAISDGSGNGSKIFDPGTALIDYSTSYSLKWWMDALSILVGGNFIFTSYPELAVMATLPGSTQVRAGVTINAIPTNPGSVYHGQIYVRKKILWFIPVNVDITNQNFSTVSSMVPVDGAPGGIYDLSSFVDLSAYPPGAIKQTQFCFVPAVSALALENWSSYLTNSQTNFGQTNFQDYYRPMPASNKLHTSFYTSDYSLASYIKTTLDNTNSYCTSSTTVQDINLTKNQTFTGCNLTIQNVTIQNSSTVTFDPTINTTINGPFEVQNGSVLEVK